MITFNKTNLEFLWMNVFSKHILMLPIGSWPVMINNAVLLIIAINDKIVWKTLQSLQKFMKFQYV